MANINQISFDDPIASQQVKRQLSFDDPVASQQVKRQQAIAEMLRQQAMQQPETNQMAGGYVVPVSPIQNIAKLAQGVMAKYAQGNADKAQESYQTSQREVLGRDTQGIIQALQGSPEQSFKADTFDESDNPFGAMTQTAVAPDRNKAIALALQSQSPVLQNVGGSMLAKALEAPEDRFGKVMPHSFTPDSLAKYQQTGKFSDLKPISGGRDFGKVNPGQFTPASLERYAETGQWSDLVPFRAPTVINRGGAVDVLDSGRGTRETLPVVPKPDQMPGFKGAQAKAEAEAKADVEAKTDQQKAGVKAGKLIDILNEAETLLPKATGSLLGAGIAKGKSALGVSDESTQANERLRLLAGWAVANVPRMEGPQSNYDVQNYREMAATLGDATKPHKDRLAALTQLRALQNKYTNPKVVGDFVGDPVKIQKDIDAIKDKKQRALAQKAFDDQLAREKQPKTTGGWAIQKVK